MNLDLQDSSFPYSSGIHQAPTNDEDNSHWHWHMSFLPAIIKKRNRKEIYGGL